MSITNVKITDECTACELCVDICPDVFEMGDEIAQVVAGADFEKNHDCINEAAESCPVEAIIISQ
jgi:ferredoxin